jgi:hypothetical protein
MKDTMTIEELFEISEVEKGDVDAKVLRQGCLSVQTPNADQEIAK